MSRAIRFAPLALLLIIVIALIWRLATPVDTTVSSKLEGKPLPAFRLAAAVPAMAAARNVTTFGIPFGSAIPIRSPRFTPAAASADATSCTCLRNPP